MAGEHTLGNWLRLQEEDDELAYDEVAASSATGAAATRSTVVLAESVRTWLELLPESLALMERTADLIQSPLFRCCDREVSAIASLLSSIRVGDLAAILDVCAGDVKSSNRLRDVMAKLSKGTCHVGGLPSRQLFSCGAAFACAVSPCIYQVCPAGVPNCVHTPARHVARSMDVRVQHCDHAGASLAARSWPARVPTGHNRHNTHALHRVGGAVAWWAEFA